ncbi:MAG: hypothetical protein HRF43_01560 [Phycisphaerae bacterium]
MAGFSLRRYDIQARFGLVVSLASAVTLLALGVLIFQNYKDMVIYYGNTRRVVVWGVGLLTILLAVTGFGFGLNSVGQRRNDKPLLSWISFFVGAGVLCLSVVLLFFFYRQGELVTIR